MPRLPKVIVEWSCTIYRTEVFSSELYVTGVGISFFRYRSPTPSLLPDYRSSFKVGRGDRDKQGYQAPFLVSTPSGLPLFRRPSDAFVSNARVKTLLLFVSVFVLGSVPLL